MGSVFDVYLHPQPRAPLRGERYEIVCSFEGGYAQFLERLFATINEDSGKIIVHADWAHFGGDDFQWLEQLISVARQRMVAKPESWQVSLGWTTDKKGQRIEENYAEVNKTRMNTLLDQVSDAIRRAKVTDAYVSFNFWGGGG